MDMTTQWTTSEITWNQYVAAMTALNRSIYKKQIAKLKAMKEEREMISEQNNVIIW